MGEVKSGCKVIDAMTTRPVTASPTTTLRECAKMMKRHRIGSLIIRNAGDDGIIGILTVRDLVAAFAEHESLEQLRANDIMSRDMITIRPGADIVEALRTMHTNDVRHLPVMDGHRLVGYLTLKDVLRLEPHLFEVMVEKYDIRESWHRPLEEGVCGACGGFSERLREIKGSRLCPDCAKQR